MHNRLLFFAATLWMLSVSACGGGSTDDLFTYRDSIVERQCDCFAASYGFEAPADCKRIRETNATQQGCYSGIIDANAEAVEAPLTCLIDVFGQLDACVSTLACGDERAWDDCMVQADDRWSNCPQYPETVAAALDACFSVGQSQSGSDFGL